MTQSAGGTKDLAAIQRGGEFKRMFTMFYSYFSALYNMGADRLGQTKSFKDLPQLAASAFYLWFAPAVLSELVAGRGPGEDEDKEKWAAKTLALYPAQAVVGLRDIAQGAIGDYGYGMTPVADAFEATTLTMQGIADGEPDKALARNALLTLGYWGQLPSRQMWITGEHVYDVMTGEDDFSLRDLMLAKRRD